MGRILIRIPVGAGAVPVHAAGLPATDRSEAESETMTTNSKPRKKTRRAAKKNVAKTKSSAAPRRRAAKKKTPAAKKATPPELVLAPRLSIRDAAGLTQQLEAGPALVDATALESVDTAVLQLLVAYANASQRAGRKVRWKDAGTLAAALRLAGLTQCIEFDAPGADTEIPADEDGLCPVF